MFKKLLLIIFVLLIGKFYLPFYSFPIENHTISFDGHEMTMDYHIVVNMHEEDRALVEEIINTTFQEVNQIYNKWNPNSEISKINRLKANETVSLSPQLEEFLHFTDHIVKLTNGLFDPTIESIQQIWKEHLKKGTTPSAEEIQAIYPAVGWEKIHFGKGKLFKDFDQTSLDLGGIAKGYCVDLLVERIVKAGFTDVLVEWSGEIRASGHHPENRPWKVIVESYDAEQVITELNLIDQSVATSGDYFQYWNLIEENNKKTVLFHILDPKTGRPLESTQKSVASATVVAPTCALADALATVAMICGSLEEAQTWADQMMENDPTLKIWLISRDKIVKKEVAALQQPHEMHVLQ